MERSDLDVWLRQPTRARDRDTRAKENDRRGGGGGVKCLGDQIAERATVAEMEGGREEEDRRKLLAAALGWGDERKEGRKEGQGWPPVQQQQRSSLLQPRPSHTPSCISTLHVNQSKHRSRF